MTRKDLHDALDRAADPVGEVDLLAQAWRTGRQQRTRRQVARRVGAGGLLAATLVGIVALSSGPPELSATDPAGSDVAASGPLDSATASTASRAPTGATPDRGRGPTTKPLTVDEPTAFPEVEFPPSGQIETLVLSDGPWLPSGTMEPLTVDAAQDKRWYVVDMTAEPPAPYGIYTDGGLTLRDGVWRIRDCGVDISGPGTVVDSQLVVTGDIVVVPDPDPGASCAPLAVSGQEWQDLMESEPSLMVDGSILVLTALKGDDPLLTNVSMVFARAGVGSPRGGPTAEVSWEDLAHEWVEVPGAIASREVGGGVWADADPDGQARLSADEHRLRWSTACWESTAVAAWLHSREGGTEVRTAYDAPVREDTCGSAQQAEVRVLTAILEGRPQMHLYGDYLILNAWLDPQLLIDP